VTITKRDPRFRGGEGGFFPLNAGQAEEPLPELSDVAAAAFFQENSLGAVLNSLRYNLMIRDNEVDPTFDAFAEAKNTALADFPEQLAKVRNRSQFQVALAQLMEERRQDEILQAGGGVGIASAVAAGVLDPINFAIPIPAAFASRGILRAAANTSLASAGAAGLQESILKSQQFERTNLEVGLNVGGAALIGGIFGAMVGAGTRGRVQGDLANFGRSVEDAHVGLRIDDLPEDLSLREEVIATRLLDSVDLAEVDPAVAREATASLQENASEIAKGNVSPMEALEHFREDFPKRLLSETGVAAQTAVQLETAMRVSRAKVEPSFDLNLKTNAGETAKVTMSAPQPPDALVGYHTRADDLVDPVQGLHREDGTFTFQLDTPLDLKSQDGFVNGVRVEIGAEDRFRLFDPEAIVDGTAKLAPDEVDRLRQVFRARGPAGLIEEGYIGLVRHVEEGNYGGREVTIWALRSGDELVSPKIEVTSPKPLRFSSLNTEAPISERLNLEMKLGLNRGLLQGGSPRRTAGVYADGRMIIPDVDRFEVANNPFGAFRTLDNKNRTDGKVNVNNATVRELTSVRGVGPATAVKIHRYISAGNDIRGLEELVANEVITAAKARQIERFIDFDDFQPLGPITTRIKSVPFLTRAMTPMFPFLRVATSLSESVRNMSLRLFDNAGLAYESDVLYRQPVSVETLIKRHFNKLIKGEKALNENFVRYRERVAGAAGRGSGTASRFDESNVGHVLVHRVKDVAQRTKQVGGPLTFREFNERVGMALRFGDVDSIEHASALGWRLTEEQIPEISRAARAIRHEFFEPFRDELMNAGLISRKELSSLDDLQSSYFTRVYNIGKMNADPDGFMRMVSDHFVTERGMLEADARIAARDVFDNIVGSHEGRVLYRPEDWQFRKSSKLRDRWLRIPEDKLAPWLEHDADLVLRLYHRTIAPDIELTRFISSFNKERVRLARLRHVGNKRKFDLLEQDEAQLLREMEPLQARIDNPDTDPSMVKGLVEERTKIQSSLNDIRAELGEDPIPTNELLGILRNDPVVPDIVNFKDVRDAIGEDYTRLLRQIDDPKEKAKLQIKRERDLRDMTEMMHLLRGTNRGDWDKSFVPVRILRGMRRFNVLTMGGGFMLSSIPDVARLVMVNGAQSLYGDLVRPMIRSFRDPELAKSMKSLKTEIKDMGVAYEVILNNRASIMSELADDFGAMNRIEKGLETGADTMFLVNLMSPWNDAMKTFAATTSTLKILRSARALSEGSKVPAETLESLSRLGLGEAELKAIWRQANAHGGDVLWDGLKTPNHHRWVDDVARDAYENAIRKEVDNIIVTPGVGDRPLLMNKEVFKTLLQFKSFAFASTLRLTHGALQARDAWVMQQVALSMALGMMVYQAKSWQYGRNTSDDPRDWFMEGLNRSGLPGIISEVDSLITYSTSGNMGMAPLIGAKTPNAFMARRSLQGTLLGPSFQRIETIQTLMTDLANGDFRRRDVSRMRDLMAFQNVWYLSWLYDKAEEGGKRLAN
jgi:hypothetical protein